MGDGRVADAADLGQGADHELLRDADAEAAGDQLVPDEALPAVQLAPVRTIDGSLRLVVLSRSGSRRSSTQ